MFVVELVGPPGVGKSTIAPAVAHRIGEVLGCRCLASEDAFVHALRHRGDVLCRMLLRITVGEAARRLALALHRRSTFRYERIVDFMLFRTALLQHIFTACAFREMPFAERRFVVSAILTGGSVYETIRAFEESDTIVVFDELFTQWSLVTSLSPALVVDVQEAISFVSMAPSPDLAVSLEADVDTCLARLRQRPKGIPQRLRKLDQARLCGSLGRIAESLSATLDWLSRNGTAVVRVESRGSVRETVEAVTHTTLPVISAWVSKKMER